MAREMALWTKAQAATLAFTPVAFMPGTQLGEG